MLLVPALSLAMLGAPAADARAPLRAAPRVLHWSGYDWLVKSSA